MSTEIARLKKESSNHKQRYNTRERKRISSVIPAKVWSQRLDWLKQHKEPHDVKQIRIWQGA